MIHDTKKRKIYSLRPAWIKSESSTASTTTVPGRPGHSYVMQLDVRNFFNSIPHQVIMAQRSGLLANASMNDTRSDGVWHLSHAILCHDVATAPFSTSGNRVALQRIPPHKRLGSVGAGTGIIIGSPSSQLFANYVLNPIDQFAKHQLNARGSVRYMDDFLLLSDQRTVIDGALLRQILATLNSYRGLLSHTNHLRLRKKLYERELGVLKTYFLPADEKYRHLKLKAG